MHYYTIFGEITIEGSDTTGWWWDYRGAGVLDVEPPIGGYETAEEALDAVVEELGRELLQGCDHPAVIAAIARTLR
jgi:hypothetical protein